MKRLLPTGERGWTLIEVAVVLAIAAIMTGVLLPRLTKARQVTEGTRCRNNLKNVGLAFRIFATDNGGKFPMELSFTNGGTAEWLSDPQQLWRVFAALSNELAIPILLHCREDSERTPAARWQSSLNAKAEPVFNSNQYLSYFLGLNARESDSSSILGGDRNLATNGSALPSSRLLITTESEPRFTPEIHQGKGNLLFGDGHVERISDGNLTPFSRTALQHARLSTNLWILP